jgi:glycosyltransferase involved in cell wall biosynthesis
LATILHLTTVHPRFDTRIYIKEAKTLASKMKCKVLLMVADGKGNIEKQSESVSIHDLGKLEGGRIKRAILGSCRSFFAIIQIKPKVVHFHDPELIPIAVLLKILGYSVIYDVHEDVPSQILSKHYLSSYSRRPLAWVMSCIEWIAARVFDVMVTATPTISERFPNSKTITVHNYPIIDELYCDNAKAYKDRPQVFAYAGALAEIRGVLDLLDALSMVSKFSEAGLELAGTFSPPEFGEVVKAHANWNRVNYHGEISREQVASLYASSRAGLVMHHPVPNEVDALPIKIFEYMSVGLPVIASDFRPLRELIDSVGCGLIVQSQNLNAIAEAMCWILENPIEAEEMGKRGKEAVIRTYNWNVEGDNLHDLYNKLLSNA